MRVAAPDRACAEVDAPSGRRYRARDGMFRMGERDGRALVAAGGFVPALSGITRRAVGYRCTGCGFGSFVTLCSRCGGTCTKET